MQPVFDPATSYASVEFYCHKCSVNNTISPPFDLVRFACPVCRCKAYPFVFVDGVLIDLLMMREALCAVYGFPGWEKNVMLQYLRVPHALRISEPLVDSRLLVFHAACWAFKIGMDERSVYSIWSLFFVPVAPLVSVVAWLKKAYHERCRRLSYVEFLTSWLSLESFDPRFKPSPYAGAAGDEAKRMYVDEAIGKAEVGPWGACRVWNSDMFKVMFNDPSVGFSMVLNTQQIKVRSDVDDVSLLAVILGKICEGSLFHQGVFLSSKCATVYRRHIDSNDVDAIRKEITACEGGGVSGVVEWYDAGSGDSMYGFLSLHRLSDRVVIRLDLYRRFGYSFGSLIASGSGDEREFTSHVPEEAIVRHELERLYYLRVVWGFILNMFLLIGCAALLSAVSGGIFVVLAYIFSGMHIYSGLRERYFMVARSFHWLPVGYRPEKPDSWLQRLLGVGPSRGRNLNRQLEEKYRLKELSVQNSVYGQMCPRDISEDRVFRAKLLAEAAVRVIQDSIISCGEDLGIDMSEYRRQMIQIHNHGTIVNEVKGNMKTGGSKVVGVSAQMRNATKRFFGK